MLYKRFKQFKEGPIPSINNFQEELAKYQGLTILYSKQCPWVARFIEEVKPFLKGLMKLLFY